MPNNPLYNLTQQKVSFTYQNLLQTDGFGNYYNGLGDEIFISGGSGAGPAGATGPTGSPGVTGPTGPGTEFYFQTNKPIPDPSNLGARWIDSDSGIEYVWVYDGLNYLWMQPAQLGTIQYNTFFINAPSYSATFAYGYYGVIYNSGTTTVTLPLGNSPSDNGRTIVIADEVGGIGSYNRGITVQATGGQLINGQSSVNMKLDWMSLTFLYRNNAWKTI